MSLKEKNTLRWLTLSESMEVKWKYSPVCTCQANVSYFKPILAWLFIFIKFSELAQLTGVAAMLRFPMPELEDEEDYDDDSEAAAGGESMPWGRH